jgi:uncharacterized protein YciI
VKSVYKSLKYTGATSPNTLQKVKVKRQIHPASMQRHRLQVVLCTVGTDLGCTGRGGTSLSGLVLCFGTGPKHPSTSLGQAFSGILSFINSSERLPDILSATRPNQTTGDTAPVMRTGPSMIHERTCLFQCL